MRGLSGGGGLEVGSGGFGLVECLFGGLGGGGGGNDLCVVCWGVGGGGRDGGG